jgi:hypothetical protein
LAECLPDMKEEGRWVIYEPNSIYDLFATAFPNLRMPIVRATVTSQGEVIDKSIREYNTLNMWDYLDTHEDVEGDHEEILWNEVDTPFLVFENGRVPVKILNQKGVEEVRDPYNPKKKIQIKKARAFGEYILDGRYKIVGVLSASGASDNSEMGSHYVSYYINSDLYIKYNDIGPSIRKLEKLPDIGVWKMERGHVPIMYFYERVLPMPIQRKKDPVLETLLETKRILIKRKIDADPGIFKGIHGGRAAVNMVNIFAKDLTKDGSIVSKFDTLTYKPISSVDNTSRLWRLNIEESKELISELANV